MPKKLPRSPYPNGASLTPGDMFPPLDQKGMYTYELIDQPTQLIRMFCFGRFLIDHQFDQLHPKLAEMEHDQAELIQVLAKAIKEALAKGWKLKQR